MRFDLDHDLSSFLYSMRELCMVQREENLKDAGILLGLIFLTGVVYWSLELGEASRLKTFVVVAAMAIKFHGVTSSFMGLNHAHGAWRLLAVSFVAVVSALYLFAFL